MTRTIASPAAFAAFLLSIALPAPALGADLGLTLVNDPVSANERKDDLYTAETTIELRLSRHRLVFSERMFTNRDRRFRFDETRIGVTLAPRDIGGWAATAELGILHVGQGLLGESAQNSVHRAVGSEQVNLPYVEDDTFHPTAAFSLDRSLGSGDSTALRANLRLETTPAFRSSLQVRIGLARNLGHGIALDTGAGIRADYVETSLLDDVVNESGLTADISVTWRGVVLAVSHNHYGTSSNHVSLGWRTELSR